jgi:hypothetical protein
VRLYLTGATGFVGSKPGAGVRRASRRRAVCPAHDRRPPAGAAYEWGARGADRLAAGTANHLGIPARRDRACRHPERLRPALHAPARVLGRLCGRHPEHRGRGQRCGRAGGARRHAERRRGEHAAEPNQPLGFLKAASELVVSERAAHGAVGRIAGVNGVHWVRPEARRPQDAGFNYFVLSLVQALSAGRLFTVWESPAINTVATRTLASDSAEMIWRIVEQRSAGPSTAAGARASTARSWHGARSRPSRSTPGNSARPIRRRCRPRRCRTTRVSMPRPWR